MSRPGIMLYFDLIGPIRALSDADKGRLLMAMLEYGRDGTIPTFDGMLAFAWEFVKPKLDKDGSSYENVKLQRKYAAYCRRRSSDDLPKLTFEQWLKTIVDCNEPLRAVTDVNENNESLRMLTKTTSRNGCMQPLPTTTTSTTTSTSTTTTTSTEGWETADRDFEQIWETYPEERRGERVKAFDAFRMDIINSAEAAEALENLRLWKQSKQWAKAKGQYIPYLANWLMRGLWRDKPIGMVISAGASGELGASELEAIRRILEQDMEELEC